MSIAMFTEEESKILASRTKRLTKAIKSHINEQIDGLKKAAASADSLEALQKLIADFAMAKFVIKDKSDRKTSESVRPHFLYGSEMAKAGGEHKKWSDLTEEEQAEWKAKAKSTTREAYEALKTEGKAASAGRGGKKAKATTQKGLKQIAYQLFSSMCANYEAKKKGAAAKLVAGKISHEEFGKLMGVTGDDEFAVADDSTKQEAYKKFRFVNGIDESGGLTAAYNALVAKATTDGLISMSKEERKAHFDKMREARKVKKSSGRKAGRPKGSSAKKAVKAAAASDSDEESDEEINEAVKEAVKAVKAKEAEAKANTIKKAKEAEAKAIKKAKEAESESDDSGDESD
jgi:hypothetical protein